MSIIARLRNKFGAMLVLLALFAFPLFRGGIACANAQTSAQAVSAVLVVAGIPGTEVSRVADGSLVPVGVVDDSGVLMVSYGLPAGKYDFVFSHKNAVEPLKMKGVELFSGNGKKLEPQLKMRTGSLTVVCLPSDVEIFIDGVHRGRGMLVQGDLPLGREVAVEARSSRLGMQAKRVKITAGEPVRVDFDLRANVPANRPDGKIVLPEIPLVFAVQDGALVKVDGVPAKLESGALVELPVGECVAEFFLPLGEKQVLVWRGAFVARSAILPQADRVAVAFPADSKSESAAAVPANAAVVAKVSLVLGSRFTISSGEKAGLADGGIYDFHFAGRSNPMRVKLSAVTPDSAIATPQDRSSAEMPSEGDEFTIELAKQ